MIGLTIQKAILTAPRIFSKQNNTKANNERFHMNSRLDELLKQCDDNSHIEPKLLRALFKKLPSKLQGDLIAQHHVPSVKTLIDFAFPKAKIAIYCDGFGPHIERKPYTHDWDQCAFSRDRYQSRALQLQGWIVLRFSQRDIELYVNKAVETILEALRLKSNDINLNKNEVNRDLNQLNDVNPYYDRGITYSEKGDYGNAIKDYTKAIELQPDYASAYYNRGVAYGQKGDYGNAIKDYTKAIELQPNYADAYNNRGVAYGQKGDYDKAIEDLTRAIGLKPNYARAYNNRGIAYRRKRDKVRARADFDKGILL